MRTVIRHLLNRTLPLAALASALILSGCAYLPQADGTDATDAQEAAPAARTQPASDHAKLDAAAMNPACIAVNANILSKELLVAVAQGVAATGLQPQAVEEGKIPQACRFVLRYDLAMQSGKVAGLSLTSSFDGRDLPSGTGAVEKNGTIKAADYTRDYVTQIHSILMKLTQSTDQKKTDGQ